MKNVLVTGAAGFIGSNLYNNLVQEGWNVNGVDDLSNGHIEFVEDPSRMIIADFSSTEILDKIMRQKYDTVVHLAALPRVGYSVEHPLASNDINVTRTLKLMDACRGNIERFVFASSSSVYGDTSVLPTPENTVKNPNSPYALQKSIIEEYLVLYNKLYDMDSAALRFFNVFGPNQLGGSAYAIAIAAWLTAIHSNKPMRSDGDGTQSRDLCYVDNVVQACKLAAKHPKKLNGERFNVACGARTTNNTVMSTLQKRYPSAAKVDAPWRPGDVMHTQADITKISNVLGYSQPISFEQGLEKTIDWYEKNWSWAKYLSLRV